MKEVKGKTNVCVRLDASTRVRALHHRLTITAAMQANMEWWIMLACSWNGKSFFLESTWTPSPAFQLFTDASDQGYGCYWQGHWLQGTWSRQQSKFHIQWKELFAVVVAAQTWGAQWTRKRLLVHCDNHAVVDIWQAGTSWSPELMKIFFTATQHNFTLILQHIQGVNNAIADALSRSQMHRFRKLAPQADTGPAEPIGSVGS